MKKLLFLLLLPIFASAQVTLPDSTRQTGGTNFSPQFNYNGTNASTAKLQIYNPNTQKYFGIYSAYQQSQLFPTFTYFNTITGTSTLARINAKVDTGKVIVFLIGGQSNAGPYGDTSVVKSPKITEKMGLQYTNTGGVQQLRVANDPVSESAGLTRNGSMWPAFALAYYQAKGIRVVFVQTMVGGSAQVAAADNGTGGGNWDVSGTRYTNAVNKLDSALTYLTAQGYKPQFGGVLWSQGEQDASKINDATITTAQYKTALTGMIARFRTKYGQQMPFYIWRTGSRPTLGADAPGYTGVRGAQEDIATDDPNTLIAARDAINFPVSGNMNADGSHYTQTGYNIMGVNGAAVVIANNKSYIYRLDPTSGNPTVQYNYNRAVSNVFKNNNSGTSALVEFNPGIGTTNSTSFRIGVAGSGYTAASTIPAKTGYIILGDSLLKARIQTANSNTPIEFATNSALRATIDDAGLHVGATTPTSNSIDAGSTGNNINTGLIYNSGTGAGSAAEWRIANSTSAADGIRIQALGTNFTTSGMVVQDGGIIRFGSGLSGGGAIAIENTSATFKIGIGGVNASAQRYIFARNNAAFATSLNVQKTVGATGDSVLVAASDGTIGRVKTLSTSQIDTANITGLAPKAYVNNFFLKAGGTISGNTILNGTFDANASAGYHAQVVYDGTGQIIIRKNKEVVLQNSFLNGGIKLTFGDNTSGVTTSMNFRPNINDDVAGLKDIPTQLRLTGSGTGAATTISIPHGLSGVTSSSIAIVQPINAASAGVSYITTDVTNVNIVYTVAPASGTNNLSYNVSIKP